MKPTFSIAWHIGWANAPRLICTTDVPIHFEQNEPNWVLHENGFITSTKGDFIKYFHFGKGGTSDGPNKFKGFGGHIFNFTLKNGTVLTSDNVWSGRAECLSPPGTFTEITVNNESGIAIDLEQFKTIIGDLGFFVVNGDISSEPFKIAKPEQEKLTPIGYDL